MKLSQLNSNKPKMETIQALNDGADEEDFKQLHLMFNREFMNDVYRTFRIISRGL